MPWSICWGMFKQWQDILKPRQIQSLAHRTARRNQQNQANTALRSEPRGRDQKADAERGQEFDAAQVERQRIALRQAADQRKASNLDLADAIGIDPAFNLLDLQIGPLWLE